MAFSTQKYPAIRLGSYGGKPVFGVGVGNGFTVDLSTKYLGNRTGTYSGKPVFAIVACDDLNGKLSGVLEGYYGGKPVYAVTHTCCPAAVLVSVQGCAGPIAGTVVVARDANGNILGTCTTNSKGSCSIAIGSYTGVVNVTATIPTGPAITKPVTILAGCQNTSLNFNFIDFVCAYVEGCDGPLQGVPVTISGGLSASGSTGADGLFCYTPTTAPSGTVSVTVVYRSRSVTWNTPRNNPLNKPCTYYFPFVTRLCVCVWGECGSGCNNSPDPSWSPTVVFTVNGTVIGSGHTDETGYLCIVPSTGVIPGDTVHLDFSGQHGYKDSSTDVILGSTLHGIWDFSKNQWLSPPACSTECSPSSSNANFTNCNAALVNQNLSTNCNSLSGFMYVDFPSFECVDQSSVTGGCPCLVSDVLGTTVNLNDGFGDVTLTRSGVGAYIGCASRTSSYASNCRPDLGSPIVHGLPVPVWFYFTPPSFLAIQFLTCVGLLDTRRSCGDDPNSFPSESIFLFLKVNSCTPFDASGSITGYHIVSFGGFEMCLDPTNNFTSNVCFIYGGGPSVTITG